VDIVGDGSDPRVALTASADAAADTARASSYGPARLEQVMQVQNRPVGPPIDFGLAFGPAKADDGGADWFVADVKKVLLARDQGGQMPAAAVKEFAALEGSSFRIKVTPDGRASDLQVQGGKAGSSDLLLFTRNAAEAIMFATVPLPGKAMGAGAQWIAETRMPLFGSDVIAYRAYRVKSIDGDRLHLTLTVKAYALTRDLPTQLQGLPKGATLEQYDAEAQGEMELVRGETLARKSDVKQQVVYVIKVPTEGQAQAQQPPQGGVVPVAIQGQATMVRGEDLRAATRP
jgi:hypothetical protein